MSTTIESLYGKQLKVSNYDSDGQVELKPEGDSGRSYKVAELLAALKSEGLLEGDFVKPVAVEMASDGVLRPVKSEYHRIETPEYHEWSAGMEVSRAAYWRKEKARLAEAVADERKLTERRDRIVHRHAAGLGANYYGNLDVNGKHIVDTIRELEDKLASAN